MSGREVGDGVSAFVIVGLFVAWLLWTYFVYQCGYHNASKDAEAIAGRKLWVRQDAVCNRVRYSNVAPWEE